MKFKEKLKTFFSTGIFAEGKFPLRFIIAFCLFICSFSTFYIALTATCTDPELATIRTMYEYGEEYVTLAPARTFWVLKYFSFITCGLGFFTDEQKEALKEYSSDTLFKSSGTLPSGLPSEERAIIKLSGDLKKDEILLKKLRYSNGFLDEYKVVVSTTNSIHDFDESLISVAAFPKLHIGAGLEGWEIILLFIASLITFCIAVPQTKKFCAKKFSPVLERDLEFYSLNKKTPFKTTVMLQGLFLAAILFLIIVCISHASFMDINMRLFPGASDRIILLKRALIPEPISSAIAFAVCFLTLFLIPLSSYKKQLKILKKSK